MLRQEEEMIDSTGSDHGIDLPIQPTGNGITDVEIAKLQAAVEEGAEDSSIETPIPDAEPTIMQA
jgi:alanine-alpha-ketoisovalerate/valine-pyruvate aminotransferase